MQPLKSLFVTSYLLINALAISSDFPSPFFSVVKQTEATFPTFTLCAESAIAYKKDVLSKHGLVKTDYICGSKGIGNKKCAIWKS